MKHRHLMSRASAALVVTAFLALAGCSTPEEVAQTCADLPDRDTSCSQGASNWSPEWAESQTDLPPLPDDSRLQRIEAPRVDGRYEVFVDPDSIARGADGVRRWSRLGRLPWIQRNAGVGRRL